MQKPTTDTGIFIKSFCKQKLYLWIIGASSLLLCLIFLLSLRNNKLLIFPSNDFKYEYFTDSSVDGKSQVKQFGILDTAIEVSFVLKEGFISPYVGINIYRKDNKPFDISLFSEFHFEIAGQGIENLLVAVITQNNTGIPTTNDFYLNSIFEISSKKQLYKLKIDQLKAPDWWYQANRIPPSRQLQPDFHHVLRINIANSSTIINDSERALRLYSFSFVRNNSLLLAFFSIIELCLVLILLSIHFLKTRKKKKEATIAPPIVITYKPVNTEDEGSQTKTFMDYIHQNFSDNNLTLEAVAEQTGINPRRIANSIMQQYGCNFKTYINQIRITEAQRLLKETKLNIGEIAFKVGFNSPNHFNRVFKSIAGQSPSEFIESK